VLKCIALYLITLTVTHFLHLCCVLASCSSVHVSTLHPLLAHYHLYDVAVYCVLLMTLSVFLAMSLMSINLLKVNTNLPIKLKMESCQIFYWYGYAETCITKAVANFDNDMFMLSTLKQHKSS